MEWRFDFAWILLETSTIFVCKIKPYRAKLRSLLGNRARWLDICTDGLVFVYTACNHHWSPDLSCAAGISLHAWPLTLCKPASVSRASQTIPSLSSGKLGKGGVLEHFWWKTSKLSQYSIMVSFVHPWCLSTLSRWSVYWDVGSNNNIISIHVTWLILIYVYIYIYTWGSWLSISLEMSLCLDAWKNNYVH